VGKVTLKSNGDEALNDEFLLKSNSDEALNDVFLLKLTAMKHLALIRNRSDEAMKHLTMLKVEAMKRLTLHRLASSLHRFIAVNNIYVHAEIAKNRAKLPNTYVKAKTTMFFGFAAETTKNNKFFGKLPLGFNASLIR
jgi:hypothetical protein